MSASSYQKFLLDINKFEKVKPLDQGTFGRVYLIKNKETEEELVAKIIFKYGDIKAYNKMVKREIRNMICCQHPAIVKFVGFSLKDFDNEDNVTIFMKREAISLDDLLKKVRESQNSNELNNTQRQIILVGIAKGMMILHQHNIIHRDLKPGNILLDENLHSIITDFGFSKSALTTNSVTASDCFGTPAYNSPEVYDVEGKYSEKIDVYSFGIIMYEIVTNCLAFPDAKNAYEIKKKVIKGKRPEFTTPVKKGLKELIEQCWHQEPQQRPSFEQIFKKLSFNIDDLNQSPNNGDDENNHNNNNNDIELNLENEDAKYYLDGIDISEVIEYANSIDGTNLTMAGIMKNVDEKLKHLKSVSTESNRSPYSLNDIIDELEKMKKDKNQLEEKMNNLINESNQYKKLFDTSRNENIKLKENIIKLEGEIDDLKKSRIQLNSQLQNILDSKIESNSNQITSKLSFDKQKEEPTTPKESPIQLNEDPNIPKESPIQPKEEPTIPKESPIQPNEEPASLGKSLSQPIKNKEIPKQEDVKKFSRSQMPNVRSKSLTYPKQDPAITAAKILKEETLNPISIPIEQASALTFDNFNNLSLIDQNNFVSAILQKNTNPFISNLNNLLHYLCDSIEAEPKLYIGIISDDQNQILNEITVEPKIYIYHSTINALKGNYSNLIEIAKCFKDIAIELQFPSDISAKIIDPLCEIKRIHQNIKISAFITEMDPRQKVKFRGTKFAENTLIEYANICSSVISIIDRYFANCINLMEVNIPLSITEIDKGAFLNCLYITKVNFIKTDDINCRIIKSEAFRECQRLKEISIPECVTKICENAFNGCESLSKVTIPTSVVTIGKGAFYNCYKLKEVFIPETVKSSLSDAFDLKYTKINK